MNFGDMNWMRVEAWLELRCLPLKTHDPTGQVSHGQWVGRCEKSTETFKSEG